MTKIEELEQLKMKLFRERHPEVLEKFPPLLYDDLYLYHGIRFGTYKEQLETIKKILQQGLLPKNPIPGAFFYSDNCNEGSRVSLLEKVDFDDLEFDTFVKQNMAIIVSPLVEAYKTIYVSYGEWLEIQEQRNLHNFYSYARHEYQVNGIVPVSMIKGIGIPWFQMFVQKEEPMLYAEELMNFCKQLGLDIPIVDHTAYNIYIKK